MGKENNEVLDQRAVEAINRMIRTTEARIEGKYIYSSLPSTRIMKLKSTGTDMKSLRKAIVSQLIRKIQDDHNNGNLRDTYNVLYVTCVSVPLTDECSLGRTMSMGLDTFGIDVDNIDKKIEILVTNLEIVAKYDRGPISVRMVEKALQRRLVACSYDAVIYRVHSIRDDNILEELINVFEEAATAFGIDTPVVMMYDDSKGAGYEMNICDLMSCDTKKKKSKKKGKKRK